MNSTNNTIDKIIKQLDNIKLELNKLTIDNKFSNDIEKKYRNFFFDNFELTNNPKDYVLCKDLTKFFIILFPDDLSAKQFEMLSSKIVKSTSIKLNNKSVKVKQGIRSIKSMS